MPIMLALSTSFAADAKPDARLLLRWLEQLNVQAVELEYRLDRKVFHDLKPLLKQAGITVVSLHNYCPFPQLIPKAGPSGDYFRLSSPDREERDLAVTWTIKTMEAAHDLEARAVVLHCGLVQRPSPSRRDEVFRCFNAHGAESDLFQSLLSAEKEQLAADKAPFVDALMFSLDRLLPQAERLDVALGLESRYYYNELPGFDDMALLLRTFAGSPLGYWHDCGHVHVQELFGLTDRRQWLHQFKENLVGMHLHDARGVRDHLAPGSGEIDLAGAVKALEKHQPAVIELAPGTDRGEIEQGIAHLLSIAKFD